MAFFIFIYGKVFCPILYSKPLDRFYTGLTSLPLEVRIKNLISRKYRHLNFTEKANDWELFFSILCETLSQARRIEIHIKKMKSKSLITYTKLFFRFLVEAFYDYPLLCQ
jgi:putative endonuclease